MKFQIQLAWRYLWGRKLRSLLTVLAIVLGVAIVFGMNGIAPVMEASLGESVRTSAHQVDLIITHKTGGVFDQAMVQKVINYPGVETATPALERTILLPAEMALPTTEGKLIDGLVVNGADPATSSDVYPLRPFTGRWLEPQDENVIVVRESLTQKTGLTLGDTVLLPAAGGMMQFEIVGILTASLLLGDESVYMPLPTAQKLFNLPGQINGIGAQFAPGSDKESVRQGILEMFGSDFNAGELHSGGNEWDSFFQMINLMITMMGVLALAMGGFIMFITFRTAVVERKQDVGILRAIGASRQTVVRLILLEGLIQSVIGTALGLIVGYFMATAVVRLMNPIWIEFMNMSLGEPSFTVVTAVLAVSLGLGIPLISCLLPALAASKVTPLEAMRPAVGEVERRTLRQRTIVGALLIGLSLVGLATGQSILVSSSALLFLLGLVVIGPALVYPISVIFGRLLAIAFAREGRLAQGNLIRQPGRAAITALTITISLAILITIAGFSTTMGRGMMGWLEASMQANYLLLPEDLLLADGNVEAGPELAEELRQIPGIAAITTLRRSETQFAEAPLQVIGIDPDSFAEVSGLTFSAGDADVAYDQLAVGRYLIANGIFAAQNNLAVGDELVLQTLEGPQSYQLAGVGIDYLNGTMAVAYISQINLAQDFHQANDYLLMANRTTDAEASDVEDALLALARKYPAFSLIAYDQWRETQVELMNLRNTSTYSMMAMLAIPALIALVNTLGINVLERIREIGMLRAVGGTRSQIKRMIIAESLLLAVMGIATGILAGVWLGYIVIDAMNMNGFPYDYYFPYAGVLITIAVGLLLGVLGALIPAHHAARLNIVAALQYE
jgi:putative ABC transport system permease protein